MLVQARGLLAAVRLVPILPPRPTCSVLLLRRTLSFSPLSFDSEYRSGLSYACGVSRVSLRIHTRTCVHGNGLVHGNGPRVGRARRYRRYFFPMRVSAVNARTIGRINGDHNANNEGQ